MKKIEYSFDQIDQIANDFVKDLQGVQVVTFTGGLGAGKTTFVQAVLRQMGIKLAVVSPTFTYFNQYQLPDGTTVYHFDLYRLQSLAQFEAAGFFEYLYQPNSIVFIEWPEIIDSALKQAVCRVKLSVIDPLVRRLEYVKEN